MNRPPKSVLRVLEKCFAAEIEGRLPAQFGRRGRYSIDGQQVGDAVMRAHNDGLIRPIDRRMASHVGLPSMTISGFALTDKGRLAYCEWAAAQPQEEPS